MDTLPDDSELLATFTQSHSSSAFSQLVARHLNLVYAAALRQTRDAHLAEDIAQVVFLLLADKASSLKSDTYLPAWLLKVTYFAASNARRIKLRRQRHERKAAQMQTLMTHDPSPDQEHEHQLILASLDRALLRLSATDRQAILLRYFQDFSLAEVANHLQITPAAAEKRVSRAVDRLRRLFPGLPIAAIALAELLHHQFTRAAPASLHSTITSAIAHPSTTHLPLMKGVNHMLFWSNLKPVLAGAFLLAFLFAGTWLAVSLHAAAPTITAADDKAPQPDPPLEKVLDRKMPALNLAGVNYSDIMNLISDISGVRARPDWISLEKAGAARQAKLSGKLDDMTLRDVLNRTFEIAGGKGKLAFALDGKDLKIVAIP